MNEALYTNQPPLEPCTCGHDEHYQVRGHCLTCDCPTRRPDKMRKGGER